MMQFQLSTLQTSDIPVGLYAITGDQLQWFCAGGDDIDRCGIFRAADISEVAYQNHGQISLLDAETDMPLAVPPGASIVLPLCSECGGTTFLKADYTLRDFRRRTMFTEHRDTSGRVVLRLLKSWHVRNLILHHLLYKAGQAPTPPVLPLAPEEVAEIEQEGMEVGVLYALWFTYYLLTNDPDPKRFGTYLLETVPLLSRLAPIETQQQLQGGIA